MCALCWHRHANNTLWTASSKSSNNRGERQSSICTIVHKISNFPQTRNVIFLIHVSRKRLPFFVSFCELVYLHSTVCMFPYFLEQSACFLTSWSSFELLMTYNVVSFDYSQSVQPRPLFLAGQVIDMKIQKS